MSQVLLSMNGSSCQQLMFCIFHYALIHGNLVINEILRFLKYKKIVKMISNKKNQIDNSNNKKHQDRIIRMLSKYGDIKENLEQVIFIFLFYFLFLI